MNLLPIFIISGLSAASLASARTVKDMAGRTVEVPDTVFKVMALLATHPEPVPPKPAER